MNLTKEKSGGRVEKKTGNVYKTKSSFLDILLENQKIHCLSFEDIRQEVDTFMFEVNDIFLFVRLFVRSKDILIKFLKNILGTRYDCSIPNLDPIRIGSSSGSTRTLLFRIDRNI